MAVVFFAGGFLAVVFFAGGFVAADGSVVAAFFAGARRSAAGFGAGVGAGTGRTLPHGRLTEGVRHRLLRLMRVLGALTTCSFFTIARPQPVLRQHCLARPFSTTNCGRSRISRS
jgi:hypothetical protein